MDSGTCADDTMRACIRSRLRHVHFNDTYNRLKADTEGTKRTGPFRELASGARALI